MITITTKLSVKELAAPLGRSVSFLYKARMVGLPMVWNEETHCFEANLAEAAQWLKINRVRIVRGRVKKG